MALTGWEARPLIVGPVSQSAGGSAVNLPVMKTPRKLQLKYIKIAVGAAITANDTNYVTITLRDSSTTYATINTKTSAGGGSGDIAANTFTAVTISTAEVDEDTNLYITLTQSGAGVDVTNLVMQIEFEYIE